MPQNKRITTNVGINAANEFETAGGTLSGNFIEILSRIYISGNFFSSVFAVKYSQKHYIPGLGKTQKKY